MTTANPLEYAAPPRPSLVSRHHFLLRRLHSLTGIVFGGYLVVHLLVNATLAQAAGVYQVQVEKIHSLPLLWAVEWAFIYLPILFHTVYGLWITVTGQPNATAYPYAKNWFYVIQRASALVIVLFMFFHVFSLKYGLFGPGLSFNHHEAARTVHSHMKATWLIPFVVYPIGILASCYHLANGFWTAAITWGLTVSKGAQRRWGLACAGLFVLTLVFGFTALVASLDPDQAKGKPAVVHVEGNPG